MRSVRESTVGLIFFGTPHRGSALGEWGEQIRRIVGILASTNPTILAALNANVDNGQLEQLRRDFNKMLGPWSDGKFSVHSFRETMVPLAIAHTPGNDLVSLFTYFRFGFPILTRVGRIAFVRIN